MELIEFLRTEAGEGQRMLDIALTDLDDSVANLQPAGTANSIGQLLGHVVRRYPVFLFHSERHPARAGLPCDLRPEFAT